MTNEERELCLEGIDKLINDEKFMYENVYNQEQFSSHSEKSYFKLKTYMKMRKLIATKEEE